MLYKKILFFLLFAFTSSALACFNDAGCPKGNVCVKTGNIMGICLSQAVPLYDSSSTQGSTLNPTGVPTPSNSAVGSSATTQDTRTLIIPSPQVGFPKIAGTCTNDINCPAGFLCSRAGGQFTGICTQVTQ